MDARAVGWGEGVAAAVAGSGAAHRDARCGEGRSGGGINVLSRDGLANSVSSRPLKQAWPAQSGRSESRTDINPPAPQLGACPQGCARVRRGKSHCRSVRWRVRGEW
jgi:hypothetical protein